MRSPRPGRFVAALAVTAVALTGCGGERPKLSEQVEQTTTTTTAPTTTTTVKIDEHRSQVATINPGMTGIDVYGLPVAPTPMTRLANPNKDGVDLVFLVKKVAGQDWLQVYLPIRPNGSTGYIRRSDVKVTSHHYWIEVFRDEHRIVVHNKNAVVLDAPVGIGTGQTPTPGGTYYLTELLAPPNPNGAYGPYAYGLSGFSDVLTNFAGGDGVIGLHGTNEPDKVGTDVSHGCIRMTNENITKLAKILPLGTPVQIKA
jgi:lipoprotein-anchoring transpeptidase ErfK/SrfK